MSELNNGLVDPFLRTLTTEQLKKYRELKKEALSFLVEQAEEKDWFELIILLSKKHPEYFDISLFNSPNKDEK